MLSKPSRDPETSSATSWLLCAWKSSTEHISLCGGKRERPEVNVETTLFRSRRGVNPSDSK
jgi:hypothetical protein